MSKNQKNDNDVLTKKDKAQFYKGPMLSGLITGLVLASVTWGLNNHSFENQAEIEKNTQVELSQIERENQINLELKKNQIKNLDSLPEKLVQFNKAAGEYSEKNSELKSGQGKTDYFTANEARVNFDNAKLNVSIILNPKNKHTEELQKQMDTVVQTIVEERNGSNNDKVRTTIDDTTLKDYIESEKESIKK